MGSEAPLIVFDASVLFPFQTSHILVFAAITGAVRARWTRRIQQEWVERSIENYPDLDRRSIERRRDLMDKALPDAIVSGYEHRIEAIVFPDPNDRHVVAAALECGASLVVTRDKKHFNNASLKAYGLAAIDPDELLCERLDQSHDFTMEAVDRARQALTKTKPDMDEYADMLAKSGLETFAERLRARSLTP